MGWLILQHSLARHVVLSILCLDGASFYVTFICICGPHFKTVFHKVENGFGLLALAAKPSEI